MSKSSRRPVRPAPSAAKPAGTPAPTDAPPADTMPAPTTSTGSRSPTGTARAGRRERPRYGTAPRKSFLERYRLPLVIGVVVAIGVLGVLVVQGVSSPTYACSSEWVPEATPAPSAGASPQLGYIQPDQGTIHQSGEFRYAYCPPANGPHYGIQGLGPITARIYGPDDASAGPQGWVHNLEHGGLVILYKCDEGENCGPELTQQLQGIWDDFPASPVCGFPKGQTGPVIARFDQMAWPYAAILWNRVLPLESLDKELIYQFFNEYAEKAAPELFCDPGASGSPSTSPGVPSAAPSGSAPASPGASPSAAPSASPSAAPSASPSPSASSAG